MNSIVLMIKTMNLTILESLLKIDPERIQILLNQLIESLPLNYGEILAEGTVVSTKK